MEAIGSKCLPVLPLEPRGAAIGAGGGQAELELQFGLHEFSATAAVTGAGAGQAFAQVDAHAASRIASGPTAFAVVDHGLPLWNGEIAGQAKPLHAARAGGLARTGRRLSTPTRRWRSAKPSYPAGSWHLTLAHTDKGWSLVFSAANADYLAKIDAFGADYVTPVLEVPLLVSSLTTTSKKLAVQFERPRPERRSRSTSAHNT